MRAVGKRHLAGSIFSPRVVMVVGGNVAIELGAGPGSRKTGIVLYVWG